MDKWLTLIVLCAAAGGWLLGHYAGDINWLVNLMMLFKTLFLSALKMIIAPLIFFSLISGVLRLGVANRMRRLGGVTLLYYMTTTGIAILIGLGIVTFIHPWTQSPPIVQPPVDPGQLSFIGRESGSFSELARGLLQGIFVNPFSALSNLNILGIVANAIAFGLAGLLVLPQDSPVTRICHELALVFYRMARWAINLVPLGVLAIVFELTGQFQAQLLEQLLGFFLVVLGATLIHGLVILPLLAWLGTGITPLRLLARIAEPLSIALTTSSSAMTLPSSMRTAQRMGVKLGVASFVLPLGATINMDGTALFEGIAAVFLAYLFGIELGTFGIIVVFFVAMLSSVGAPGIPSGSMAGMQVVLLSVGIPLEAIGILLLVERPLDTIRTAVNVEGDLIGSLIAQKFGVPDG